MFNCDFVDSNLEIFDIYASLWYTKPLCRLLTGVLR